MEDYQLLSTHASQHLFLNSPIDDDGCFDTSLVESTKDDSLQGLTGKAALSEGTTAIIDHLRLLGHLFGIEEIEHKYPYDWKSKTPVIVR